MNLYFEASKILDSLDARTGSIKGVLATLPEKDRKRTSALVIETLKYKAVLTQVINETNLLPGFYKIMRIDRTFFRLPNIVIPHLGFHQMHKHCELYLPDVQLGYIPPNYPSKALISPPRPLVCDPRESANLVCQIPNQRYFLHHCRLHCMT
ncbi:uncharacterized protein EV420DRAFT_74967 [Desarmillaria tabescens]|uniref:Uncharacterized protein n=1 Tax=Armillaria tabescens TaxID=1929756 RepID=A0AA39U3E1_ARMTA|nr:uncharacterized protein EV420DRAFT_74967 [Desarmillaria tabescens]KAK0469889.1 hypothetical protein EV420DRAFT_74967 [Desarmillaria tabescens]